MPSRMGPNDWRAATAATDDGHAVWIQKVEITGSSGTSNVAIVSPLGTNTVAASVAVTPATASSWAVTGTFWQATQPVSGTVTANLGTIGGAATEATLAAMSAKLPATLGGKVAAASLSVISALLEYETVAASQTDQVLGGTGATGDYLSYVIISPGTTSPGNVIILDNATPIYTFAGGASSVPSLVPIIVPIGSLSVSGAWKVTTGSNVTVAAFGDFTA